MKETNEEKIMTIESIEEAKEFRKIATGRRFFKVGERDIDIVNQEIERYQYEHAGFWTKLFQRSKFHRKEEKYLLESRIPSAMRAVVAYCMRRDEEQETLILDPKVLVKEMRKVILEIVREYEKKEKQNKSGSKVIEMKSKMKKEA